jgi:5-methyltetrahydropteroyltriglutamate--homocysteine methyltransferase
VIRSTDRILATHAGSLPRPEELFKMVLARSYGDPYNKTALEKQLPAAVADVVRRQVECGLDSINDGELSKASFSRYVAERIAGFEARPFEPGKGPRVLNINDRDKKVFPGYFSAGGGSPYYRGRTSLLFCVEKLRYTGHNALKEDFANFSAALKGVKVAEAFLPANSPGTIEHWLRNEYYKDEEEFLYAIADVMHEEYKAIVDAGFLLQIDDPDLADAWQMYPEMNVAQYRKYARLRVDAQNHALRGIPTEKIRLHACWGSPKGPHEADLPLSDIVDLIFRIRASSYSIEAANPRHQHEWDVFKTVKVPNGAVLIPGVVGHYTDWVEHPELVAQRIVAYARLVGRENVMASTDCGLGTRVHNEIAWAKLKAIGDGCRLATKQLWARPSKKTRLKAKTKKRKA